MYQKRKSRIIKHIDFLICDLLVLSIAFYISNLFRHGWNALHMNEDYKLILGIFLLFWLFEAIFFEFYQDILRRGKLVEFKNVIVQTSIVMVSVFTFMFVTKTQENYSRMVFGVLWLVGNIMLYVERLLWKHIVRNKFTNSEERAHLLIVSNASSLGKNIRCLQREKYQSYVISGVVGARI